MLLDTNNRNHYDIITALRGPDLRDEAYVPPIKTLTSAVLRHFVGCGCGIPAEVVKPTRAIQCWEDCDELTREGTRKLWNSDKLTHFRAHVEYGFCSLSADLEVVSYYDWFRREMGK